MTISVRATHEQLGILSNKIGRKFYSYTPLLMGQDLFRRGTVSACLVCLTPAVAQLPRRAQKQRESSPPPVLLIQKKKGQLQGKEG